jgi:hypothetical protein
MANHTTPKIDSYRIIVRNALALYADLASIDTAISVRDAIKARMGDCRDEAEARQLLSDLTRAEESVTIKRIREARLRADLAGALISAEDAFYPAFAETEKLVTDASGRSVADFIDLLRAAQLDEPSAQTDKLNEVTAAAVKPNALARRQLTALDGARRAVAVVSDALEDRVNGAQNAIAVMDKILAALPEIAAEAKRLAVACDAFIKALTKRW